MERSIDCPASTTSRIVAKDPLQVRRTQRLSNKILALNLSLHYFRNVSCDEILREKFHVIILQRLYSWRRVTVTCNYKTAPLRSLENDLQKLKHQTEKYKRIYKTLK